ncbi:hypothetical protein [Buttiauxella massiliensis]|uniref:hypothetical protein n=1 Tax=Buttiauxella massiliensis TaxID=2831590 RepID=UPI00125FC0FB|nr:hypothetical protein [Buttiauxella massiliensis]
MPYKDFYHFMLERFSQPAELVTLGRKQPFTLYAEQGNLYVKNASNSLRRLDKKSMAAFIEHYEETNSQSPKDYQDVTFNASYLLAAMKYLSVMEDSSSASTIVRFHSKENPESEQQYRAWLKANPNGYVLSLPKKSEGKNNASTEIYTCLHAAICNSINNDNNYSQPEPFTGGDYFKVCAKDLAELEAEARTITTLTSVKRCSLCIRANS